VQTVRQRAVERKLSPGKKMPVLDWESDCLKMGPIKDDGGLVWSAKWV
jgi:hypothetical protein